MSDVKYQCPRTLMSCPHPNHSACEFTRRSKAEFDDALPGDTLVMQNPDLLCDGKLGANSENNQ